MPEYLISYDVTVSLLLVLLAMGAVLAERPQWRTGCLVAALIIIGWHAWLVIMGRESVLAFSILAFQAAVGVMVALRMRGVTPTRAANFVVGASVDVGSLDLASMDMGSLDMGSVDMDTVVTKPARPRPRLRIKMVKWRGVMCIELQEYALSCQDDVEEFSWKVAECLHPTESPKIVLNLSETIAIGSQMLGEIIALSKQVRALGGRMTLCNLQPPVRQLFTVSQLDRKLPIVDDLDAAIESLV